MEPGKGYLGRVSKLDGKDAYARPLAAISAEPKPRSEVPVEEVLAAELVTLNPVYDYREQVKEVPLIDPETRKMVQDPNMPGLPIMQPMRTPLVMPVGFTLIAGPIHLRGARYDFRFLSQLDKRDAETLRGFARETRQMMKTTRLQASGLTAPTPEERKKIELVRG